LGHIADAEARAALGGDPHEVLAMVIDRPAANGRETHDAAQECALAHAVAAHDAGAGTLGHRQGEIPQAVALTVVVVQPLDREHQAPRYTSITLGSRCTSSMLPSASTRPSCSTVT